MLNLSSWCPRVNDRIWPEYLADFLLERCLRHPLVDGYYMDNSGANIWWVGTKRNQQGIDANNDQVNDDKEALNQAWEAGIRLFLGKIRADRGQDFILIGNKMSVDLLDILDGRMSEEFPNPYLGSADFGGWYKTMQNYAQNGPYSILQAIRKSNSQENRLFVLASTLMGDGFYMYGHNFTRAYPEYRKIGYPKGNFTVNGEGTEECWTREFDGATVKVWPQIQKGEIVYKEDYHCSK
jgi:hypothetical protein